MTSPANSTTNNYGAREYTWPPDSDEPERFPSVTTLLSQGMPKEALINWAAGAAADCALNERDTIEKVRETMGYQEARKLIVNARWRISDKATSMGSVLHEYAEQRAAGLTPKRAVLALDLTQVDAAKFEGYQTTFEQFLDEWKPEYVRTEFSVFNRRYLYAGTSDGIAVVKGHGRVLFDYKTSKAGRQGHGIYPETALQLNAYASGEFIGERNGTESQMPEVDSLLAINIRHNGYHVVGAEKSERAFRAFIYASQVARFVKDGAAFLSSPLAPPVQEVAS